MKNLRPLFFTAIPFCFFGSFNALIAPFWDNDPEFIRIVCLIHLFAVGVLVGAQVLLKDRHFFPTTILLVFAIVSVPVFTIPKQIYTASVASGLLPGLIIKNPQIVLYSVLAGIAVIPPVLHWTPFTAYFARFSIPPEYWHSRLFKAVTGRISLFWGVLFLSSLAMQMLDGRTERILAPLALQLVVGIPVTIIGIPFLMKRLSVVERTGGIREYIASAKAAIAGIPLIYDRASVAGESFVIQFTIQGREKFVCHLAVDNGICAFYDGPRSDASLTVSADADAWMAVARRELSGAEAFFLKRITITGNLKYLGKLDQMTNTPVGRGKKTASWKSIALKEVPKVYHSAGKVPVKKVVAILGSPRSPETSKSTAMTMAFLKGCAAGGAAVETVSLKDMNINPCVGCYSCWTQSPGRCVFRDDVPGIIEKVMGSDLVVYSFPLYHFGINSLMKKYLERTLPTLEPTLQRKQNGGSTHPLRLEYRKKSYAVIIGAAGFPELDHFGPASANFHALSADANASEWGMHIVAELYRPAAEGIAVPFYNTENARVMSLFEQAGLQIVTTGTVDPAIVNAIASVAIGADTFRVEANLMWDACIREGKTLSGMQKELMEHA